MYRVNISYKQFYITLNEIWLCENESNAPSTCSEPGGKQWQHSIRGWRNWTLWNKLQWNISENSNTFIHENAHQMLWCHGITRNHRSNRTWYKRSLKPSIPFHFLQALWTGLYQCWQRHAQVETEVWEEIAMVKEQDKALQSKAIKLRKYVNHWSAEQVLSAVLGVVIWSSNTYPK